MKVESKYDRAVRDDEGERLARDAVDRLIETEVGTAKSLERMRANHAFVYAGASSVVHLAGLLGLSRRQALRLSAAGRALRLMPVLEEKVLDKELPLDSVAALAKILEHPSLQKDAWEWLRRAADRTPEALAREIKRAIAEEDLETVVEPVTLMLAPAVRDKMGRVREILSAKSREVLTNEQVVEISLDYYLDREDPDRVEPGARRKGRTANDPSRSIPREARRAVLRRGRRCQVKGCPNHLFLAFAHGRWHASGGSREPENLLLLCWLHHWMLDHGLMRFSGTAEDPVFRNSRGEVVRGPRAPPAG